MNNLPFVVLASSSYICKSCLGLIKKRRGLKEKLSQSDRNLIILYKAKVQDFGNLLKRKQISPKKLKFNAVADQTGGLSYVNYSVAEAFKDSCFGIDVKTTLSIKCFMNVFAFHWRNVRLPYLISFFRCRVCLVK